MGVGWDRGYQRRKEQFAKGAGRKPGKYGITGLKEHTVSHPETLQRFQHRHNHKENVRKHISQEKQTCAHIGKAWGKEKSSILAGTEECSCLTNNSVARVGNNGATLGDSLPPSLCTCCFLSRMPYFPLFFFNLPLSHSSSPA